MATCLRAGEAGLKRDWWVKCDQVSTIEKTTAVHPPLGTVGTAALESTEHALKLALELP
ncbi:MAG: hypothetical protein ABI833_13870 [Acidobacteriota bacterium]